MKKRNSNKWIVILLTIIMITVAAPVFPVLAASATLTVSTTAEEIHVGDTVEVVLTIKADTAIGDFEGYLCYDDSILEFYSAASCITGGAGVLKISDIGASKSAQERSYHIIFNAIEKGECKIEIYGRPVVYSFSDGTEMSVTGFSKSIMVYPSSLASSDSTLSALHLVDSRIKTVALTPAFSADVTTYYASVPYEATGIIVSAITTDRLATVQVIGDGEIACGNNEIRIRVTAEDGSGTDYMVYLYRAEEPVPTQAPQEIPTPTEGENASAVLTPGIVLEETKTDILITEYHTYRVCEKPDTFLVPEGYVETTLFINEIQVTAYAKQGASEEFVLLVLANEHGQVQWYRYDRAEETLQRVSDEEFVITQQIISNDEAWKEVVEEYKLHQMGLNIAVAFLAGSCVFLLMLIVWLSIRNRRQKNG